MNNLHIIIRIDTGEEAVDWNVQHANSVTFKDTLDAISQVLPGTNVSAFEYEDEDGDRITVRSNDEMAAMISYYLSTTCQDIIGEIHPLVIYPRVSKTPVKRNIDGLKIQVRKTDNCEMPMDQDADSGSSKKRSGDIHEILACGSVVDSDLHYVDTLGAGSCGQVYKAIHLPTATMMAVKVIRLDISVDAQKQIISELGILHRCDSSLIISFYGAYFKENQISICAEYMDGGSVDKYGQIAEQILGRIAVSVVKGLQYLWSLKIMHRDVKPCNMLVNTQGQVKLCDFGVSVQLIDSIAKTFIGTNAYMAPERINGEPYSIQSEVWSLGVSLFEMAVGRFPYKSAQMANAKPMDFLKSIVEKDPPQLPTGVFSDDFVDFVSQCMQKRPQARPAPEALMHHPFIEKFDDEDNNAVVSRWVRKQLASQSSRLQ